MDPANDSGWQAAESRRMIEDARALVAIAQGLARARQPRGAADAEAAARVSPGPAGAVLIHALSVHDGDLSIRAVGGAPTTPILVLLDDAPGVPEFLPEPTDVGLEQPTEESVRRATERHVREALRRGPSENHILDLVESIRDSAIVIDRQRTVLYLNPSATALLQRLTGRTGPFLGQPIEVAFPPALSPTTRPAIHAALVHADASHIEDPQLHHGIALDIAIFPHPNGATLLVRDVTERRNIEAELIETRLRLARAESLLRARDDEVPA